MAFFGKKFNRDEIDAIHHMLPKESPLENFVKETKIEKSDIEMWWKEELVGNSSLEEAEAIIYEKQIEDESSSSE